MKAYKYIVCALENFGSPLNGLHLKSDKNTKFERRFDKWRGDILELLRSPRSCCWGSFVRGTTPPFRSVTRNAMENVPKKSMRSFRAVVIALQNAFD